MQPQKISAAFIFDVIDTGGGLEQRLDAALGTIKGISFSEFRILAAIGDAPGGAASRVELAGQVRRSPSGVTRALQPLEKLGFVETVRDARDARQARASLTPEGIELVADARGVIHDAIDQLAANIGTQAIEVEATRASLRALRH